MWTLELIKTVNNIPKLNRELLQLNSKFAGLFNKGENLVLRFSSALTQEEVDAISSHVNNFVEICITEQLKEYVEKDIKPFIENFLYQIQAENISMGITQLGKTADVLGFFCERITLPGKTRAVSFKNSVETNSLTVTIELLNYYIDNPSLYSDLSPFITVERLTAWKNAIEDKLS